MGNNMGIIDNLSSAKVSSSICRVFKSPSRGEDPPAQVQPHRCLLPSEKEASEQACEKL